MRKQKSFDINANWTANSPIKGWRHYRVSKRFYKEKDLWLELMAVCDSKVLIQLSVSELKNGENWLIGWK